MKHIVVLVVVGLTAVTAGAAELRHRFLACGQRTYIVEEDGSISWSYPAGTRDGYVLENGDKILTLSKSKLFPGGAVMRVTVDGEEQLIWRGTQGEVNSAQPTSDATFVITEAGPKPRLLELGADGEIVHEFPLACQTSNVHMQTRMARKLPDGTYLAPHLLDFAVFHYDSEGTVLGRFDTTADGDSERRIHTWPFTAIRHRNGRTLVCCTHGNRVLDFDNSGRVVRTVTNDDLPGDWLQDPCGGQVLPNGNIVITSYAAGRADRNAPKLIEIAEDGRVVWTYSDGETTGIHHFQILTTNGEILDGPAHK